MRRRLACAASPRRPRPRPRTGQVRNPCLGRSRGSPGADPIRVMICSFDDFMSAGTCDAASGPVLETGRLSEADRGPTVTLDAAGTPGFSTVAGLLTSGDDDVMMVETKYRNGDGSFGGSGSTMGPESLCFFHHTQPAPGIGFRDLEELEIDTVGRIRRQDLPRLQRGHSANHPRRGLSRLVQPGAMRAGRWQPGLPGPRSGLGFGTAGVRRSAIRRGVFPAEMGGTRPRLDRSPVHLRLRHRHGGGEIAKVLRTAVSGQTAPSACRGRAP